MIKYQPDTYKHKVSLSVIFDLRKNPATLRKPEKKVVVTREAHE